MGHDLDHAWLTSVFFAVSQASNEAQVTLSVMKGGPGFGKAQSTWTDTWIKIQPTRPLSGTGPLFTGPPPSIRISAVWRF